MSPTIEPLDEADLDRVADVLRLAYKVDRDYHYILRLHLFVQPHGSLVARLDGDVVGFGAATNYGPFSYIALMATHPRVQRQGIARRVLDELVAWTERSGCPTMLLDSSAAGQRLYETSGFTTIDRTIVFRRESREGPVATGQKPELMSGPRINVASLVAFDSPAFGADRARLLGYLLDQSPGRFIASWDDHGMVNGYLVAQANQTIGPWVASDRIVAEALLSRAIREFAFGSDPEVLVSGSNEAALAILHRHGFKEQRTLSHMVRGRRVERARATKIFGQTSLGLG